MTLAKQYGSLNEATACFKLGTDRPLGPNTQFQAMARGAERKDSPRRESLYVTGLIAVTADPGVAPSHFFIQRVAPD